ncbi:MAG: twin-arginine translocation signal domain-containing protein [Candidatus Eisenbacteria bacterium]|uniref:Twin-arginine translocation signal domain-containing protein n=1 Tax=Eiseniibacteriota bacterium TaxID=2212470 RepID=A0A933SBP0_UNCEI|nr:twin-arginine translocation signal domain-containing protein [Candidatus Eisenbacteria bacterium]
MSQTPDAPDHARREFLKLAGAAALAAALPPASQAFAQGAPAPAKKPAATTTPAPAATAPEAPAPPSQAAPAPPSQDALALAAVLRRRVKAQLTDAQWESIARDFDFDLSLGKRLRAIPFANADEPDVTFKA